MSLYRNEVAQSRSDRLVGSVLIALPVSWRVTGYLLFGGLIVAVAFASTAQYSRVETVAARYCRTPGSLSSSRRAPA